MSLFRRFTLAIALACAAVVLGAAAEAQTRIGPRGPLPPQGSEFPADGAFVYRPDPGCGEGATAIPDLTTALCMRSRAVEYLISEVSARRVVPGPAFTVCNSWAPYAFPSCVDWYLRLHTPEIRWAQNPSWVEGHIGGVPWTGCAAGIAYPEYVRVSFADPARTYRLVSWETANSILAYRLDLTTSADGPIVGAATNYAAQACGVN